MSTADKRYHRIQINGGTVDFSSKLLPRELFVDVATGALYYGGNSGEVRPVQSGRAQEAGSIRSTDGLSTIDFSNSTRKTFKVDNTSCYYDFDNSKLVMNRAAVNYIDGVVVYDSLNAAEAAKSTMHNGQLVFVRVQQ